MSGISATRVRRRTVLGTLAAAALMPRSAHAQAVKWSSGIERPRRPLPAGTVDTHHHIYDARYPVDPKASLRPSDALVEDYRACQGRLGFKRHVLIQPSTYGLDNRCLLDALAQFGDEARAVVVIDDQVDDDALRRMHEKGVRGVRFNLSYPAGAPIAAMRPVAARIAPLGWHIQIVANPSQTVENADLLRSLPVPVVFDHLAQIGPPGLEHPAFKVVSGMLEAGKAWVKLSGPYSFGSAHAPDYLDAALLARAYLRLAPERLVWGTDWPHPTAPENAKPDDAQMVDLFSDLIGSDDLRRHIFAENPTRLYGFAMD